MNHTEINQTISLHNRLIILSARVNKHAQRVRELSLVEQFVSDNKHLYNYPHQHLSNIERKKSMHEGQIKLLKSYINTLR